MNSQDAKSLTLSSQFTPISRNYCRNSADVLSVGIDNKLLKSVGPVPTYYAAVRLEVRNPNFNPNTGPLLF